MHELPLLPRDRPGGHRSSRKSGITFKSPTTTCFTCHFNNEGFNTGTSTCLNCHSPPQQEIMVHAEMTPPNGPGEKRRNRHEARENESCRDSRQECELRFMPRRRHPARRHRHTPRLRAMPRSGPVLRRLEGAVHRGTGEALSRGARRTTAGEMPGLPFGNSASPGERYRQFVRVRTGRLFALPSQASRSQVDLLLGRGGLGVPKSEPNLMFGSRTNCTRLSHGGSWRRQGGSAQGHGAIVYCLSR